MTYDDFLKQNKTTTARKHDEEHQLQCFCVRWFQLSFPEFRGLLFAVPNGGRRDQTTGRKMKEEGVVAGVADLILFKACGGFHGLAIEMKTEKGRQSDSQKSWEKKVIGEGYKYSVVRSFDDFKCLIISYLHQ